MPIFRPKNLEEYYSLVDRGRKEAGYIRSEEQIGGIRLEFANGDYWAIYKPPNEESKTLKKLTPAIEIRPVASKPVRGNTGSIRLPKRVTRAQKKKLTVKLKNKHKKHKKACSDCRKKLRALRKKKCVKEKKKKNGRKKKGKSS